MVFVRQMTRSECSHAVPGKPTFTFSLIATRSLFLSPTLRYNMERQKAFVMVLRTYDLIAPERIPADNIKCYA